MAPRKNSADIFNNDVESHRGYVYTTNQRLSSRLATDRQVDLILSMGRMHRRKVIDIGCGDGTFTVRFWDRGQPAALAAIEPAEHAIAVAVDRRADRSIDFRVAGGTEIPFPSGSFDLAVMQGVLHHCDDPAATIKEALRVAAALIAVEPNGWNPILKLIERFSQYHRQHDERSFTERQLKSWLSDAGCEVTEGRYAILVPYFCPDWLARVLKRLEPLIEATPVLNRLVCAPYVFRAGRPGTA